MSRFIPDMLRLLAAILCAGAAHELGHVVFDVPMALGWVDRRYRSITAAPDALVRSTSTSERRANEFMGALLAPPVALHTRMLALARSERMRLVRAPHHGCPASPVLAGDNAPEALAGVIAVVAGEFGVSDGFIAVRMARYRLVAGGRS